jgi:hypothetical protein
MKNADEILKKILLNMKYDSSKSLKEQSVSGNSYQIPKNPYETDVRQFISKKQPKIPAGRTEWSDEPSDGSYNEYDKSTVITYKSIIPGELITAPLIGKYRVEPLTFHDKNIPFNESSAKSLFGNSCQKLSGQSEKYTVGYSKDDYYMYDNGNKCEPIKTYSEITNTKRDAVYDYQKVSGNTGVNYFYRKKGTKEWKNPTNVSIKNEIATKVDFSNPLDEKIKYEYPQGCKPLPFDVCLRWSWMSLNQYGGVDKGLSSFKFQNGNEITTYKACIKIPTNFNKTITTPWLAEYSGYYDTSKTTEGTYDPSLGVKVSSICPKGAITSLPATPSVYYGNENNQSESNLKKKEELAKKYINQEEDKYKEQSNNAYIGEKAQSDIDVASIVISTGLRIVGK